MCDIYLWNYIKSARWFFFFNHNLQKKVRNYFIHFVEIHFPRGSFVCLLFLFEIIFNESFNSAKEMSVLMDWITSLANRWEILGLPFTAAAEALIIINHFFFFKSANVSPWWRPLHYYNQALSIFVLVFFRAETLERFSPTSSIHSRTVDVM